MAKKQRKKRNKKYNPVYKSDRKDYRKGGRVALREGTPIGGVSLMPPKDYKIGNYGPTPDGTQRGITPLTTGTVFGEENLLQPPIGGAADASREDTDEADPPYTNPYTPPAPSYESGGEDDPNREDRVVRTGFRAEDMAQGILPEEVPQIDEPEKIGRAGTEITPDDPRYFMGGVEDARAGTVSRGGENVSTDTSREAQAVQEREATQMDPIARTKDVMLRGQETRARGIDENLRGQVTDVRDSASVAREQAELDRATTISGALSSGAFAAKVSNKYSNATLAPTPDAERQNREAIVDSNAVGREAASILGTINYEAAQRRTVTGQAAIGAAATMIAEVAEIPEPLAAAIVESPASVEAQIDNQPVEVQAAVASLPLEATISGQMELLMGSLEEGEVPQWARPAVDAVERLSLIHILRAHETVLRSRMPSSA